MMVTPVVIDALGTITEGLLKGQEVFEINSSGKPSANAAVKNSQRNNNPL